MERKVATNFGEPERETNTRHNHRSSKDRLFDPDYGKGNASEDEDNGKQGSGITSCQTRFTQCVSRDSLLRQMVEQQSGPVSETSSYHAHSKS